MTPDSSTAIALLVLLGTFSGFMSSLLGIGGGILVVPALIFGLPVMGVSGPEVPKIAMATSLALIVPTSISGAQAHAAKGSIDWGMLVLLAPCLVLGALASAIYMVGIEPRFLVLVFAILALRTAYGLLRDRPICLPEMPTSTGVWLGITLRGILGGALASMLGMGVAFFAVPLLQRFMALPKAIGTATALALPMALAGTTGHLFAATPEACVGQCAGYVFLPGVAAIGISAVLAAPLGAWAAHRLPTNALKKLFASFLVLAVGSMASKTLAPNELIVDARQTMAGAAHFLGWHQTSFRPAEPPLWIGQPARTP
jgi:uncharacterized protein